LLFPLFTHVPSVYTTQVSQVGFCPGILWVRACEICDGSTKILKHSDMLSLHVRDGSKVTLPLFCLVVSLLSLRVHVRDRPSCLSPGFLGFSLGGICCSLVWASDAHLWGL
jgi:hypothetical protein